VPGPRRGSPPPSAPNSLKSLGVIQCATADSRLDSRLAGACARSARWAKAAALSYRNDAHEPVRPATRVVRMEVGDAFCEGPSRSRRRVMPASPQRTKGAAQPANPTPAGSANPTASTARPTRPALQPWAYTVPEAAELARVSERTVWTWVKTEKVHCVRINGVTRVGAASLRELLGLAP
jgi:hypothetical protein